MGIITVMTDTNMPKPVLVDDDQSYQDMLKSIRQQKKIGVDTESNSLFAYREQVCLIQISVPQTDYLVDPFSFADLDALQPIFADPLIEKILHGAEYDVICLKRDFDFHIRNLFDTRVACRTLGREKTGLANLLQQEFNVKVNKRWQRANWGTRPLPDEQMHYARMDTHFLIPLRNILHDELRKTQNCDEANEECQRLTNLQVPENGFHPDGFWQISNAKKLKAREAAVLREIYIFRDEQARRQDRPLFKIMSDRTLLEIAQAQPQSQQTLHDIHGMTSGQLKRYGRQILAAVKKGLEARTPTRPKHQRLDEVIVSRYKKLMGWRKETARARNVESDVILPRDLIWDIANLNPASREELQEILHILPWRFEKYGPAILQELRNMNPKRGK